MSYWSSETPKAPSRNRFNDSFFIGYDWVLITCALLLSIIGSALVFSASKQRLFDAGINSDFYLQRHIFNIIFGIVLALIVSRFSFRTARAYAIIIYIVAVIGLVMVLIPGIGKSQGGAQAWISLPGGFSFQPSEFTKIALIVLLAMVLTERRDSELIPDDRDVLFGLALAGVPALLILLQNDFGTVMIIGATLLSVMVVAGVKLRWIYGSLSAVLLAGFIASQLNFIKDYQLDRLATFVDPTLDPLGAGYNSLQARIAIGSGGWFGQGYLNGPQTQGKYVPAQRTDFIFTVAGEELGFLGSTLIIFLLAMILFRLTKIALKAPDRFGRLAAAGIAGWFAIQTFENIGMSLGIMPVTGVPLPFVSYGGSSMFVSWMAIGLAVAIGREIDDRVTPLIR
ncbi:MAG: rod shape-determining protein RodA [Candidatus Nanopelagicales bacterium]|jgi:rod shape determining protein RodA|nr:rod shape-determining protein RodA [Candidatus Nanopelagicales bacterium]MDP4746295.1 rod shape-determining protein RodA [Candidatus Nanopelagicales bacterium]MDP4986084.1 rod shape-determining protein RodA [Candidatus Nanopelagicales bacterium]MDP5107654.1 rod shape-determining protein RodA [Candidatus Nanopelagicales bacterium]